MKTFTLKTIFKTSILLVMITAPLYFCGQNRFTYKNWRARPIESAVVLSFDSGTSTISGDTDENKVGLSIHSGVGYYTKFMGVKFKMGYETLGGTYTWDHSSFKTRLLDTSIHFHIDAIDLIFYQRPHRFNISPHAGIGVIYQKTVLYDSIGNESYKWGYGINQQDNTNLSRDSFIGRKLFSAQFGVEVSVLLTPSFFVYTDYSIRYADTRHLDGMNFNNRNDWVNTIKIGVAYKIDLDKKRNYVYRKYYYP